MKTSKRHTLAFLGCAASVLVMVFSVWQAFEAHANPAPEEPASLTLEQEQTVSEIYERLRCTLCNGAPLKEATTPFAEKVRSDAIMAVRDGNGKSETVDYLLSAYPRGLMIVPDVTPGKLFMWLAPLTIAILGGAIVFAYVAAMRLGRPQKDSLSLFEDDEEEEVKG